MWSDRVVVDESLLDLDLGFPQGVEYLAIEQLIAEANVDAFSRFPAIADPPI